MNCCDRKLKLINGLETVYLRIIYYDFHSYYNNTYSFYEYNRLCTFIKCEKKVRINNKI